MSIALTASYGDHWDTGISPFTASVTVVAGDCLVVVMTDESGGDIMTVSGGGLTYTNQASLNTGNASVYLYTAFPVSGQTYTLTASNNLAQPAPVWGYIVLRFTGVASIGAKKAVDVASTSTPTTTLTTTAGNSAIVAALNWTSSSGTTMTWSTATAGTFTSEGTAHAQGQDSFCGFYANAGAPGTKTIGVASSDYSSASTIGAIELVPPATAVAARSLIVNKALRRSTLY